MINLFERYNEESKLLFTSLKQAGYTQQTIFLEETGFLPIEATSPYAFFLQQAGAKFQGKPLYFNQLRV
ncbi:MAG: accessory Sec system glycosylation chaperone GtfB, partial [Ligilactobacillus agilis]|nr:accessory Sec system glycosylation chaperone GtfB [Ligilactobacillus agilis]